MRGAFVRGLVDIAREDERVVLLTADLGFMALEPFAEAYPERFLNVGVAEQDMVGVACGLAEAGFLPFCYSIAGASHHGLEDIGLMRLQPQICLIAPADYSQTLSAVKATWDLPGPVYYRIGKDDRRKVPGLDGHFELGKPDVLGDGADLLLLSTGAVSVEAAGAVQKLAAKGVRTTLAIVSTLNPSPGADLLALLGDFPVAITVEAHRVSGGLGSLVCEVIAENRLRCQAVRVGVSGPPTAVTGSEAYLLRRHGLDRDSLTTTALNVLAGTYA
ncbi:MAG: 1-deoxy-D-xylulose-5-phosphate synthase [Chloroflexi bacterium]|nr:MAG: 1-deoxy-D-xylulose-5-phosphate synthase [Chloroflexota bacterium]